jgi:nitroreductase
MDKLLDAVAGRRARRALSGAPVPTELVDRMLAAAALAPSCMNKQPWRFLVMDAPAALALGRPALSEGNYWAKKAPVLIAAVTKPELDCRLSDRRDYALFDLGLAAGNLLAQATADGLVAHPIAGYDPAALKSAFGIGEEWIIAALVAVAYPGDAAGLSDKHRAAEDAPRQRLPAAEVAFRNAWPTAAEAGPAT